MPAKRALRPENHEALRVLARRIEPIVRTSRLLVPVVVGVARRNGWANMLQLFKPDGLLAAIQYVIAPPSVIAQPSRAQSVPGATATLRDSVRKAIEKHYREALSLADSEPGFSTSGLLGLLSLNNREYVTTLGKLVEKNFSRAVLLAVRTAYKADPDARRALMDGASDLPDVFGRKVAAVARAALRREMKPLGGEYPTRIASWVKSHMPKYDHGAGGTGTTADGALGAAVKQKKEAFHKALCELVRIVVDLGGVPIVRSYPDQPLRFSPLLLPFSATGLVEALGKIECEEWTCSWSALETGDNSVVYIEKNRSRILSAFLDDEYVGLRSQGREISSFATDFAQLTVLCGEVDDKRPGAALAPAPKRKRTRAERTAARNGRGRGGRGPGKTAERASSGTAGEPGGEGARDAQRLRGH
ncbi:hypothetical protein KFE25_012849 [Diacronema lutheri]|uniref:Uncharacterized protein n=1 Tax=Diacronema lutheri TaxID=2081491 RepID=A0A8J5XF09_DIALT|nr:hypothetical protein KFE25_012849 [Diacronema lutheri]